MSRLRQQAQLLQAPGGELAVVRAELDPDALTAVLAGDEGCRARAGEGVEDGAGDALGKGQRGFFIKPGRTGCVR